MDDHVSIHPPPSIAVKAAKHNKTVQLEEAMYLQIEQIMQKEQRSFNWVATRLLQLALNEIAKEESSA